MSSWSPPDSRQLPATSSLSQPSLLQTNYPSYTAAQTPQRQPDIAYQQPHPPSSHQQQQGDEPRSYQQPQLASPQPVQTSTMSYQYLPQDHVSSSHFGHFPSVHHAGYPTDVSQGYYDARSSPRSFVPIAPDPAGLQRMQSLRSGHDLGQLEDITIQRQHSTSSNYRECPTPPMLRDEDKLLLQLKDEESLPWRDIVARMSTETGQNFQIPALQMRYRRLKDRMRIWTPQDLDALRKAYEYWDTKKFEIIANKMQDFGVEEKWTPRACQRKWTELNPGSDDVNLSRRSTLYSQSPQAPYTFHLEPGTYGSGGFPPQPHGHW